MAGAGLDVPLTRGLRLKAAARSLLMSAEDADNVSLPTRVYGSPTYTAGVELSFGTGRSRTAPPVVATRAAAEAAALDSVRAESARLRAETARLRAEVEATQALYAEALATPDSMTVRRDSLMRLLREARLAARPDPVKPAPVVRVDTARSNISNRVLQIPVPEVGEIYIRFGTPGSDVQVETAYAPPIVVNGMPGAPATAVTGTPAAGLTAEQIQTLVRETIRAELSQRTAVGQALTQADVERAVREALRSQTAQNAALETVAQRLNSLETRLAAAPVRADTLRAPAGPPPPRARLSGVMPLGGVRWGTGATQALVGVKADLRLPSGDVRFVPEVIVGLGDGVSFAAFANGVLPLHLGFARSFQPYVGAGVGLNTRSGLGGLGLALNLLAGTEYPIGPGRVFAEYSTLDFFQYHRVLAGYRIAF